MQSVKNRLCIGFNVFWLHLLKSKHCKNLLNSNIILLNFQVEKKIYILFKIWQLVWDESCQNVLILRWVNCFDVLKYLFIVLLQLISKFIKYGGNFGGSHTHRGFKGLFLWLIKFKRLNYLRNQKVLVLKSFLISWKMVSMLDYHISIENLSFYGFNKIKAFKVRIMFAIIVSIIPRL